jgi:hypothetical protein
MVTDIMKRPDPVTRNLQTDPVTPQLDSAVAGEIS